MQKFHFFDAWGYEVIDGFTRRFQPAIKDARNPLLTPDRPWEHGNITLYGSVAKASGRPYQLWYTVIEPRWHLLLAYAESEDGIEWRKPELDIYHHDGQRTNIVFAENPHGAAVLYDEREPREDWRYKLVCGADPTSFVYAYHSADGVHWRLATPEPIIGDGPDSPMALLRRADGTYVAHHRTPEHTRRIGRSESDDFMRWHGGRIVLEPGPDDPPRFQMYGMGATAYGNLEIGTLWDYYVDREDNQRGARGYQETEFTYSRSGLAWHRPAPHQPLIAHGEPGAWDSGNVQAASAPLFLEDEVRYYYASSNVRHSRRWELLPGTFGIGMARVRPDRWIALQAGPDPAEILTRPFRRQTPEIRVNAEVEPGGSLQMELLDVEGRPISGFEMAACLPVAGDSLGHIVRWQGDPDPAPTLDQLIRWRLRATRARLYAVCMPNGDPAPRYDRFTAPF